MPKVSVVMPSLNVGKYIGECLDSVRRQTLQDIEIICVDAGSDDGTLEIIKQAANEDSRIIIIEAEKRSYGYQMNLGIAKASGEFIGIVETDDIACADMFEYLYKVAKEWDADYVKAAGMQFFDVNGERIETTAHVPAPIANGAYFCAVVAKDTPEIFWTDNFLWYGIYSSKLLKSVTFRETPGAAFQDVSTLFRIMSTAGKALYSNRVVYLYRQDNAAASSYSRKSVNFVADEYSYIIDNYLDGLSEGWRDICYGKMARLLIDRFRWMGLSGEYWSESASGIEWVYKSLKKAESEGYDIFTGFSKFDRKRLGLFLDSPLALFEHDKKTEQEIRNRLNDLAAFVSGHKAYIFGAGLMGKYLEKVFRIRYGIRIDAFLDNSNELENACVSGISVKKPNPDIIRESRIVIANKNNGSAIRDQLLAMHMESDHIMTFVKDDVLAAYEKCFYLK